MNAYDVVVVGAGPAGIAAAVRATESGASVAIIDDNPSPGGQIWRGGASPWISRLRASAIDSMIGARVIAGDARARTLLIDGEERAGEIRYTTAVLATGAREIFLPFPGWTLPGVMGAGGLQAMVKGGLSVEGKRVVVGGSGPLLLAVAAFLRSSGAHVKLVAEQAPLSALAPFAAELVRHPAKLMQAVRLQVGLAGIGFAPDTWVEAAEGRDRLERVRLRRGDKTWAVECEYAAIGYGLYPNTELASHLGCRIEARAIAVDEFQRTSVDGVLAAGECTGIGGVDLSLVEGEIAGYTTSGRDGCSRRLFRKRDSARRFASALDRAFALRSELEALPREDTIVCRCEDVVYSRIRAYDSFRAAKLHTRCGMGACQGRVCGAAADVLFGWRPESIRPPVFPARIGALALNDTTSRGHSETQ